MSRRPPGEALLDRPLQRPTEPALRALISAARRARRRAVAPYSGFKVGAALLTRDGRTFGGCNIENASYGLTLCAERVAVFKAVSEGVRRFRAVAVVSDSRRPGAPCGPCRQILWEFCDNVQVLIADLQGRALDVHLAELLPLPFDRRNL